jgi:hypothetical protein
MIPRAEARAAWAGAAALVLLLAGCAAHPLGTEAFAFAVTGDTPYNAREERRFAAMLREMDARSLAFVIHVGDFKSGSAPCTDELYRERRSQFDRSAHPFILTPGDNDWTDCRHASPARDPLERLERLRAVFFADRWSLGREPIETQAQSRCIAPPLPGCGCDAHPENRMWLRSRVRFVTLNVPGSHNNVGFDAANDREARCRDEANRQWLERAVGSSEGDGTRALVIALQADPWATTTPVYEALLAQVARAAEHLGKPVLFVHGDSHTYRLDAPFFDASGRTIGNLTRLETFGSPFVGWVEVSVDPDNPRVFGFEPHFFALVP